MVTAVRGVDDAGCSCSVSRPVSGREGAWRGRAGSAAGCRGEEADQAEQAQKRLPVRGRSAAEGDRGVRAGGEGRQCVAQRRAGRLRVRRVTARGQLPEDDHHVLAHHAGPDAQAAQPAAHVGGRNAQVRADPPGPGSVQRRGDCRRGDNADGVRAPGRHPGRQQHASRGTIRTGPAAGSAAPGRHRAAGSPVPGRSRPAPHGGQASAPDPRSADAAPASAHSNTTAALPGHGSTIPPRGPRRQGAVRVAGCQARHHRATRITRISEDGTMSARKPPGNAVTGTSPSVLTVSSRTESGTSRPHGTGTLIANDADPALRAHRESRRTAKAGLPRLATAFKCIEAFGPPQGGRDDQGRGG
jgi:hypothetical protein